MQQQQWGKCQQGLDQGPAAAASAECVAGQVRAGWKQGRGRGGKAVQGSLLRGQQAAAGALC